MTYCLKLLPKILLYSRPHVVPQVWVRRPKSKLAPLAPFLNDPSMFSPTVLRHHWGCLPVIIISLTGMFLEFCWTCRLALTRDDVRSLFTKKMAIDNHDYTENDKPPRRKFIVINQKYEWPPGLIDALAALKEPEEPPPKKTKK